MSDVLLRVQVRLQTAWFAVRNRQEGQGLVEYGLIIASIAILLIVAMLFLAGKIDDLFSKTGTSVDSPGRCRRNWRLRAERLAINRPLGQLCIQSFTTTLREHPMHLNTGSTSTRRPGATTTRGGLS
jgi:pilus assembly protein Flp/PilA